MPTSTERGNGFQIDVTGKFCTIDNRSTDCNERSDLDDTYGSGTVFYTFLAARGGRPSGPAAALA